MIRWIVVLVVLLALGVGGYVLDRTVLQPEGETEITLYGNIDIRDVALGFRVAGRLKTLNFEEGDAVEEGDVLAELDDEPFREELALRQAELAEAEATLGNAEKLFNRRAVLARSGTVSQSAYDDALAARDEARARVRTASARLQLARTVLDDATIRAPDHGAILTRVREPGSIVAVGAPVYTMALERPVWVRTYIDEPRLGEVFPGQAATVHTDSGGTYRGQVGFISPQAEFTPKTVETTELRTDLVYRLRVIVTHANDGLRQGMPVTVSMEKREPGSTGEEKSAPREDGEATRKGPVE